MEEQYILPVTPYSNIVEEVPTLTVEDVIVIEKKKEKRIHRRNSSMNFQTFNRKKWLNDCFDRFKEFINHVSCKTLYRQNLNNWLGKISNLNMLYLSIEATIEFEPVLNYFKNEKKNSLRRDKLINEAMAKLALIHDIDIDEFEAEDYNKLIRYITLFIHSLVED